MADAGKDRIDSLLRESTKQTTFLGLRASALGEVLLFICAILMLDFLIGSGDRFASLSLHPFWIVVLLTASYYGTNEGLVAAALSTGALLVGNVPDQVVGEDLAAWLLRMTAQPVLWFTSALILGEVSVARRQEAERLRQELHQVKVQADLLAEAYEQTARARQLLEMHIASQRRTVRSLAVAAQAIEQPSEVEVLRNAPEMVRAVMSPEKFSVFLADEAGLIRIAEEGWTSGDRYWSRIMQGPLFEAIVERRETLSISDSIQAQSLCEQGLMAAPIVEAGTGRLIGMLKIERMDFHDLNLSTLMDFKALCNWIGHACERAKRLETYRQDASGIIAVRNVQSEFERSSEDNVLLHIKRDGPWSNGLITSNSIDDVESTIQVEIDVSPEKRSAAKRRSST